MATSDARVVRIAERQAGLLTRRQALAAGLTDRMIGHRVSSGLWERESPGAYRLVGASPAGESAALAACLKIPGAVISHESAARLLDFPFIPGGPAVVTVRRSTTHSYAAARVHESTDLEEHDCETRGPISLTGPTRTIIDLAAVLRPTRFARLLDELLAARLVTLEDVVSRHGQLARRGKPGTALLRTVLEERGLGWVAPESELEARFLEIVARAGLPEPERQVPLPWRPDGPERVDFAYSVQRLIVECDGRRWHTRQRDFERDRQRDNEAMLAGWRLLRLTHGQLFGDERGVASMVRMALEVRAA